MIKRYLPKVEALSAKKINWNILWISIGMGLLFAFFQEARIQPLWWFVSPKSHLEAKEQIEIFQSVIKGKLTKVPQAFSLTQDNNVLVGEVNAEVYIPASSFVALDFETGEIILEKNADEVRSVASLTKIMTAIVALDLAEPEETFEISQYAADRIPTKIGIVIGQHMSLNDLLKAALMTSANDAAEVIREGIDTKYGEEVFIRAMNEKAHFLGLKHTSFDNPQGFDGRDNYSSAKDLALLSHYAMKHYHVFAEIVKDDYDFLPENNDHKQFDLINWNGLIGVYPNTYGIKIGYTERAGKTTVVASERNGKHVLVVLLGTESILDRDYYAASLLDQAFEKAYGFEPVGITEEQLQEKYATWNQYY